MPLSTHFYGRYNQILKQTDKLARGNPVAPNKHTLGQVPDKYSLSSDFYLHFNPKRMTGGHMCICSELSLKVIWVKTNVRPLDICVHWR